MSVRTETLQLRVLIDGTPARRELATLDQEYAKLNAGLKDLKKGSDEATAALKRMGEIKGRQAELRQEIGLTSLTAKQLGDELRKLQVAQRNATPNTQMWAENAARIEEVKARLKELNDVNARAAAAWEVQRQQIRLTDMTMEQLEQEAHRLRTALRTMDPNSPLFANTRRQLDEVNERMGTLGRSSQGVASRMRQEFSAMATSFVGIGAAIYGAVRGIGTFVRWNAELSDSLADVRKTTGLSEEAVVRLSNQLAQIDTRTSREELLMLARDAGKLGITGEADLLKFVRAGDQINVALGEDLGEGAIQAIGKLNQTFKVGETTGKDLEQQMLSTGSAINVLGMSSTASEAFLVDFTTRMAGVNTQAKINIQDTLGYAAALDQLGQRSETSSTALAQFTLKAFSNTAEYAKIAGMELGAFTELLNTNANEALLRTLEGLKGNNEGLSRMTTLFSDLGQEGARAVSTLASLANNTGLVRQQQVLSNDAFREGTSLTEEFSTKNNTLQADLDKLSNAWKNFVTGVDQGSGVISTAIRGLAQVFTGFLSLFTETDADLFMGKVEAQIQRINPELAKQIHLSSDYAQELGRAATEQLRGLNSIVDAERKVANAMALRGKLAQNIQRLEANQQNLTSRGVVQLGVYKQQLEEVDKVLASMAQKETTTIPTATLDDTPEAAAPDEKVLNKARAELEALRAELEKGRRQIELDALSADERELAQLDAHYAQLRAQFQSNEQTTAADLLALDELHAQARAEKLAEQGQKRIDDAANIAQQALKAEQDAQDSVFLGELEGEDLEITQAMQRMDAMVALYEKAGVDTKNIVANTEAAIAAIRKKYRTKEEQDAATARNQRIQEQIAIYQGVNTALAGVNGLLAAAYAASGNANYQNTVGAKALGLAQIAIASGVGVAEAIKAGAGIPFPANLGAIATGVGAVLTGIANAINLLNSANITKPSFGGEGGGAQPGLNAVPLGEKGGIFSGPSHADGGLKVVDPQRGRVVAEVEGGEPWMVLSKAFRHNNPGLVPMLLHASATGARLPLGARGGIFSPVPAFNFVRATEVLAPKLAEGGVLAGGSATAARVPAGADGDAEEMRNLMRTLVAETRATRKVLSTMPTTLQARVSFQDIERRNTEMQEVRRANKATRA
jgi:TP901 family phage tail tape measure protein